MLRDMWRAAVPESCRNGITVVSAMCRARLFKSQCDRMSTCAKSAQRVIALMVKNAKCSAPSRSEGQNNSDRVHGPLKWRDSRAGIAPHIFEELMIVLNHEGLLDPPHCCSTLAQCTLQEAIRLACDHACDHAQGDAFVAALATLESELASACRAPSRSLAKELELLVPQHMGQGITYLERLAKRGGGF